MHSSTENLQKCINLANRLGISVDDIQKFEDCERITDMLQEEYIEAIKDAELQRVVRLMKRRHKVIRAQHAEPFVRMTESLYGLLPRYNAVLDYHTLEQLLESIDDNRLKQINEPELRKLLVLVKHIHEKGHGKRKAEIYRAIVNP